MTIHGYKKPEFLPGLLGSRAFFLLFLMDYCQDKGNGAADALSCFLQRNNEKRANFQAENTQILHCLQSSLTNASISGLNILFPGLSPQHQVIICGTYALPQLRRFWNDLRTELANEQPYKASIGSMRLRLQELQETDSEAQELRQQKADGYEEIDDILHHQGLPFVPEAI